jgi:cytochrome c5
MAIFEKKLNIEHMKKMFFAAVVLFAVTTILHSCKKESTAKVAFTHSVMKPWFDLNCAGCHASGASNAGDWLYDPTDYEGSISMHLSHIKMHVIDGVNPIMPPNGLSQAEKDKFIAWFNLGGPATN